MQKSQGTHWGRYQLTVTAQGEDKVGGGDPSFFSMGGSESAGLVIRAYPPE